MQKAKSVDDYYKNASGWRDEIARIRIVLQSTNLTEELKWGAPCYMFDGQNVVGVAAFKSYFGLWFHQGALLKDDKGVLMNAQEGTTRALRQWRMKSCKEIKSGVIKAYVKEAVQLVKDGRKIGPDTKKPVVVPVELKHALKGNKKADKAYKELRKGLRREYADYIANAKQDATKQRRLGKILPMIISGQGLNDKYRKESAR